MKLKLHISPCPNDTFMFDALINGRIDTHGLEFDVTFADIEELNRAVLDGQVDVCKASYAVLAAVADRYAVLDSGSALGRGNGPLLVGRGDIDLTQSGLRVAIPGIHTTANLLLDRLFPALIDRSEVLFSQIAERVARGEFDAGVLIHEGRFTYAEHGLELVADLGKQWEARTGAALPLGGIMVSRSLPDGVQKLLGRIVRESVEYGLANPDISTDFVRTHAQELSGSVIRSHIELFVNDYSVALGEQGREAVRLLTGLGEQDVFVID